MTFKFHPNNSVPTGQWIWVFGSNEAGRHGKGAARVARVNFRAEYGTGRGPTGNAYAIPTKDRHLQVLPLASIERSVADFLQYAALNPEKNFFVTAVGTEPAGFKDDEIGPLFAKAPENCSLPDHWRAYVSQARSMATPAPAAGTAVATTDSRVTERCPFCGHLTYPELIETPDNACTHEVLHPQ